MNDSSWNSFLHIEIKREIATVKRMLIAVVGGGGGGYLLPV